MDHQAAARVRDDNALARAHNEQVITEFRANKGVVGGHFQDVSLLLLHHVGRRTGKQYVLPMLYLRDGDSFLIAGSNGGHEKEPAWVANLAVMPETIVEVGEETLIVKPEIFRERTPEHKRLYAKLVEYWPDFLKYEKNTDRVFPVIRLHVHGSSPGEGRPSPQSQKESP